MDGHIKPGIVGSGYGTNWYRPHKAETDVVEISHLRYTRYL